MLDLRSFARVRTQFNTIGQMGHSALAQSIKVTATSPRNVNLQLERSAVGWLSLLGRGQFIFPENCKVAVSSTLIKDIYTTILTTSVNTTIVGGTQLSNILANKPSCVLLDTGENDVVANASLAKMVSGSGDDGLGLTYILNQLSAAGIPVILCAQYPRGNASVTSARYTSSQLQVAHAFRQWVLKTAPLLWPGMVYGVDYWPIMADRAGTVLGDCKAALSESDGLHWNSYCAYLLYQKLQPILQQIGFPQVTSAIHQPGDTYHATNNPNGNLAPNGDLLGSVAQSGTTGGVTLAGVVPTKYTTTSSAALQGGTGITITGSQVTGTPTGDWYQMVIAGTTSATQLPYFSLQTLLFTLANLNPGDTIAPFGEFEIASGSVGICALSMRLRRAFPGSTDTVQLGYGDNNGSGGPIDSVIASQTIGGTWNGDLSLQPWLGTESAITFTVDCILDVSKAVNATVRVRNLAVRKT